MFYERKVGYDSLTKILQVCFLCLIGFLTANCSSMLDLADDSSKKEDAATESNPSTESGSEKSSESQGTTGQLFVKSNIEFKDEMPAEEALAAADFSMESVGQSPTGSLILGTGLSLAGEESCDIKNWGLPLGGSFEDANYASRVVQCQFNAPAIQETARGSIYNVKSNYCAYTAQKPLLFDDKWYRGVKIKPEGNLCFSESAQQWWKNRGVSQYIIDIKGLSAPTQPVWKYENEFVVFLRGLRFPQSMFSTSTTNGFRFKYSAGGDQKLVRSGNLFTLDKAGLLTFQQRWNSDTPIRGKVAIHTKLRVEGELVPNQVVFSDIENMHVITSMTQKHPVSGLMTASIYVVSGTKLTGFKTQSFRTNCDLTLGGDCNVRNAESWKTGPEFCQETPKGDCSSVEKLVFNPVEHGDFTCSFIFVYFLGLPVSGSI